MQIDAQHVLAALLSQEDTDGSKTITIDDTGPKSFTVQDIHGKSVTVEGTYYLANLLQEVWLGQGRLDMEKVSMKPLARVDYLMKNHYWPALTRRLDQASLLSVLADEKRSSDKAYLYVPAADAAGLEYYRRISAAHPKIEIIELPSPPFSTAQLAEIDKKPGLLALKYDAERGEAVPYVVPGGRFNEMYGWDSYFIALGLMAHDQFELARGLVENTAYQIKYYGKMLNANRSYYLTRSQPPFYTALLCAFYRQYESRLSTEWLAEHLAIAIDEYEKVWMNPQTHLFAEIGLNRYFDEGSGRPKETEPGHFKLEIGKYAKQKNLSAEEYEQRYDAGEIVEPELDRYFVHDRAMRESGHDTTARLDDLCADLACVDLNAVLYDVELKISALIDDYFPQGLRHNGRESSGSEWYEKAQVRYDLVQEYLWNEEAGCFYDYNVRRGQAQIFDSATNLYPLWAGLCEPEQAEKLVRGQLPKLMCAGGISATAPLPPHIHGPERQWDYPYGWAPHQILLWEGLQRYGYHQEMHDAAYAWVQMIIRATVEYNGLIPEKFDVVKGSHKTDVEYGNVGTVFEYLPAGGFGWTNASLILGIAKLTEVQKAQLNGLAQTVD